MMPANINPLKMFKDLKAVLVTINGLLADETSDHSKEFQKFMENLQDKVEEILLHDHHLNKLLTPTKIFGESSLSFSSLLKCQFQSLQIGIAELRRETAVNTPLFFQKLSQFLIATLNTLRCLESSSKTKFDLPLNQEWLNPYYLSALFNSQPSLPATSFSF